MQTSFWVAGDQWEQTGNRMWELIDFKEEKNLSKRRWWEGANFITKVLILAANIQR